MILKDICVLFIINSNQPAQNSVFCKISVFAQHWSPHGARFLGVPGTISPPKPARIEWFTSADGGWSRQHFDEIKGNFIVGLRVRKRWFWSAWQCTCSSRQLEWDRLTGPINGYKCWGNNQQVPVVRVFELDNQQLISCRVDQNNRLQTLPLCCALNQVCRYVPFTKVWGRPLQAIPSPHPGPVLRGAAEDVRRGPCGDGRYPERMVQLWRTGRPKGATLSPLLQ